MGLKVDTTGLQSGVRSRIKQAERYLRSAKSVVDSIESPSDFPKARELRSISNTIAGIESSLGGIDSGVGGYVAKINEAEARNQAITAMLSNMALGGIPNLMEQDNPLVNSAKDTISKKITGIKSNYEKLTDIRGEAQAKISKLREISKEQKIKNFKENVQKGIDSTGDFIEKIVSGGKNIYSEAQGLASKVNDITEKELNSKLDDIKGLGDKITDVSKDFVSELESKSEKIFDDSNKSEDSQANINSGSTGGNNIHSNSSAGTSSTGGLSGTSSVVVNGTDKTQKVDKASIQAKVNELVELLQKQDITKEELVQIINKKLKSITDIITEISDSKSINIKLNKRMDSLIELMKKNNMSNSQILMAFTGGFVSAKSSKSSSNISGRLSNVTNKSENSEDINKTIEEKEKVIIDKAKDIIDNKKDKKI